MGEIEHEKWPLCKKDMSALYEEVWSDAQKKASLALNVPFVSSLNRRGPKVTLLYGSPNTTNITKKYFCLCFFKIGLKC